MTVFMAGIDDLPGLKDCAEEFYASSKFLRGFNLEMFVKVWTGLIESGSGVIFGLRDKGVIVGAIGGLVFPDLYSGVLRATEMFWFVRGESRGDGLRLFHALEDWAKMRQCTQIVMVHLSDSMPDRLKGIYERLGFIEMETHFVKEIG